MNAHRLLVLLSGTIAVAVFGCGARPQQGQPRVRPGIEVLLDDSAHLIAGRRIGLITNQAGVDSRGTSSINRLHRFRSASLVALFAPEHGIRGAAAPGELVSDTLDAETGLPIYSLYGANRAPTREQLERLDALLIDLQDVGARPYTYITTAILSMRAAAEAGRRVILLDRPNPIGCTVQGPVLDPTYASSIGMLPVPLRHGMTLGELARLANAQLAIGADLVVVPVSGWRCEWFDQTGLPWVRPSPNLPDLEAVAWYPGTVLFEATNLSVGRGTDAPFRQIGAPWLTPPALHLPGGEWRRAWEPITFTPRNPGDGKFSGVECQGLRFPRFDRARTDPIVEALRIMALIAGSQPDSFRVDRRGLALRLGIAWDPADAPPADGWAADRERFRTRAAPYLLYPR
ncbi:MAG TPA: DUF1343 domain-containing protein [Gemmatimonadales bacterium]|nr:DUF1343 domain-containing protein [Gemmatimonadales bacterium]